jgi:cytochrome P450
VKNRETGTLDHGQLVGMASLLLLAGHETTANMISLGTVALLENPDQLAQLRETPGLMPQAVEEMQELDFHRSARHHVAFGYGVHQCLGQNLARLELEIVFETLFRRIPGLRLAVPASELSYKDDASVYGIYEVPVTW